MTLTGIHSSPGCSKLYKLTCLEGVPVSLWQNASQLHVVNYGSFPCHWSSGLAKLNLAISLFFQELSALKNGSVAMSWQ